MKLTRPQKRKREELQLQRLDTIFLFCPCILLMLRHSILLLWTNLDLACLKNSSSQNIFSAYLWSNILQAHVEYETTKRHYAHVDCPGHADYVKVSCTIYLILSRRKYVKPLYLISSERKYVKPI